MLVNVANPFIFYSLYSIFKSYLWDGSISNGVPVISFGSVDYLPGLRAGLTPFGIEYHMDNYLSFNKMSALVDISYGDQTFHDSWGGVGVHIQNIYSPENFSFDLSINVWNQPELKFGYNPAEIKGGGIGGAFSVRGYYNFPGIEFPLAAVLELGYKSVGFIEGYELDSSPIFMIGLALRN